MPYGTTEVSSVNAGKDDEIDSFFRYWLKSKHADTRKNGQRFDGDYHREMFKSDMDALLHLDHNPTAVKTFLKGDFRYYTDLYARLLSAANELQPELAPVFYNGLNELDSQYLVILAACTVDDEMETEKIAAVARGLDRMFTLLQLQGSYDHERVRWPALRRCCRP